MVRRKEQFWEYVEDLNGRFRCNFCKCDFAGGISRIKSHLSGLTCRGIDICKKVSQEVRDEAVLAIGNPCKKAKTCVNSADLEHGKSISASSHSLPKQSLQPNSTQKICERDKSINDRLAKFLISNNIAFDVVETQSFIDYIKGVAEYGSDYELPNSLTLQTEVVPQIERKVEKYIEEVKKTWDTTGCTIMLDKWSNFIIVFAYSPKGAIFLRSYEITDKIIDLDKISRYNGTDDEIIDVVSSVIEDIGVDHVVQLITSNATIVDLVGSTLIRKYPKIYKIHCVADEIHSLLKDIYDVPCVGRLIIFANLIVINLYDDADFLLLMRKYTNNKELKHPCKMAKFAFDYQILQSVIDIESELRQLVTSEEWGSLDYNEKWKAKMVAALIESPDFWSQGAEVLKALAPLIQVLRLVEDDVSTSGYLYEAMEKANEAISQLVNSNSNNYEGILTQFLQARKKIIHPIHAAAAFLNPSYMYHGNLLENREVKEGIDFMLHNLVAGEEKKDFTKEMQRYRNKVSQLFTETAVTMLETSHPRVWWEYCGDSLPVLKKYAMRILSQPCKCSFVHKHIEVARALEMKRDAPKMQNCPLCLKMNELIMEKFKALESRCLEPIELENCGKLPDYMNLRQHWGEHQTSSIDDDIFKDIELIIRQYLEIESD